MEGSHNHSFNHNKWLSRLPWDQRDKIFRLCSQKLTQLRLSQSQLNVLSQHEHQGGQKTGKQGKWTGVDLSENKLRQINIDFFLYFPNQFESITKLDLSRNQIDYLPSDLDKLSCLKHLNLYSNNIRNLVPCLAKMGHLKWLNLNRNPINSVSLSFRKVAGPMVTDRDCEEAAAAVVSWMQETVMIQQQIYQKTINDDDHDGDQNKDKILKRKMRNLATLTSTSSSSEVINGYKLVGRNSSTRFKVIRPPGSPPILIKDDAFILQPMMTMDVKNRYSQKKGGFHTKSFIIVTFFLIILTAVLIPSVMMERVVQTYLFFLPCFLTKLITTSHSMIQSFVGHWLPKVDPHIFGRLVTELIVKFVGIVTGSAVDCIRSGIL